MATYHVYYLLAGALVGSADFEAADDEQAAGIAREQGQGDAVEIWNAHSRIRILKPRSAIAARIPGAGVPA